MTPTRRKPARPSESKPRKKTKPPSRSRGPSTTASPRTIERVQTGLRMEKRLLKVLKALAEYHDMTLGDLLEGIVLHAFEGKTPFSGDTLDRIADLKRIYDLDLSAADSHRLREVDQAR